MVVMPVVAAALGIAIGTGLNRPVVAEANQPSAGVPRYSVVDTEGVNLMVTDNHKNTVYFYTADEGEKLARTCTCAGRSILPRWGRPRSNRHSSTPGRDREQTKDAGSPRPGILSSRVDRHAAASSTIAVTNRSSARGTTLPLLGSEGGARGP